MIQITKKNTVTRKIEQKNENVIGRGGGGGAKETPKLEDDYVIKKKVEYSYDYKIRVVRIEIVQYFHWVVSSNEEESFEVKQIRSTRFYLNVFQFI